MIYSKVIWTWCRANIMLEGRISWNLAKNVMNARHIADDLPIYMRRQTAMQIASHDFRLAFMMGLCIAFSVCMVCPWSLHYFALTFGRLWNDRKYSLERNKIIQIRKIALVTRNDRFQTDTINSQNVVNIFNILRSSSYRIQTIDISLRPTKIITLWAAQRCHSTAMPQVLHDLATMQIFVILCAAVKTWIPRKHEMLQAAHVAAVRQFRFRIKWKKKEGKGIRSTSSCHLTNSNDTYRYVWKMYPQLLLQIIKSETVEVFRS